MSASSQAVDRYVARFEDCEPRLGRDDPGWLQALRRDAIGRFAELGFPDTRLEEWRYTSVAPLTKRHFEPGQAPAIPISRADLEEVASPVFACTLFVFVNGRFAPELSTPLGEASPAHVESLARLRRQRPALLEAHLARIVDHKQQPFAALNTAFLDDGAVVTVPEGVVAEEPLHLVFLTSASATPTLAQPRILVVAEPSSQATIIQDHVTWGDGPCFTNTVTEVSCSEDSRVELVVLQREGPETCHFSNLGCRQGRNSRFVAHTLSLGGALVRNDLGVLLGEEGGECELYGLFAGSGSQTLDNHTLVDHAMPHCRSNELYKGILGGTSRGVFRGRVIVRPDAQKTEAWQSNPNILLDNGAEIDTKPQLEIHADDVKCSHGSSIGRLDEEALFYLRSRGIAEAKARDLLARGFAAQVLERLPAATLRESLGELMLQQLWAGKEAS